MTYDGLTLGSVYRMYSFSDKISFTLVGMGSSGLFDSNIVLVFQVSGEDAALSLIHRIPASTVVSRYPDIKYSDAFDVEDRVLVVGNYVLDQLTPVHRNNSISIIGFDETEKRFIYDSISELSVILSCYNILLGSDVELSAEVCLCHGCVVESKCKLGSNVRVGVNSIIRSGTVVMANASVGSDVIIGRNSFVSEGVKISNGCRFGNASVVNIDVVKSLYTHTHGIEVSYWGDTFVNIGSGSYFIPDIGRGFDNVYPFNNSDGSQLVSDSRVSNTECLDFQDCYVIERLRELLTEYANFYNN